MNNAEYLKVIAGIKSRIHEAQRRAVLAANSELITLNWYIVKTINEYSAMVSQHYLT
jgi:predicted HicB family RNase H-like nuclease